MKPLSEMTLEEKSEVLRELDRKIENILAQLDPVFVEMLTTNPANHENSIYPSRR